MPTKKSSPPLIPAKQTKIAGVQNHAVTKHKNTKGATPSSKNKKIAKPDKPQSPDNIIITCEKTGFEVKVQGKKLHFQHKTKKR